MFFLGFADDPDRPERSLFHEPDEQDQLTSADLQDFAPAPAPDGLTQALPPQQPEAVDSFPAAPDGSTDPGSDAVDPAAAEASLAFISQFEDDSPPPPEPPATPFDWLVPWAISLAAHVALIIFAVFVVWSVRIAFQDEPAVVPLISLSDQPGVPLQVQTTERIQTPLPVPQPAPAPMPLPTTEADLDIDLDLDLDLPAPSQAITPPQFETPAEQAAELEIEFMGSGGNARDIVFIVEGDGSIVADFATPIAVELSKSIAQLAPSQRFALVFFDSDGIKTFPRRASMLRAQADTKAQAIDYFTKDRAQHISLTGSGDPVAALEQAIRLRPQLIFLLSGNLYRPGSGKWEIQRDQILEAVNEAVNRNIAINTIEFNDYDPLAYESQFNQETQTLDKQKVAPTLMEQIATMTGGTRVQKFTDVEPRFNAP